LAGVNPSGLEKLKWYQFLAFISGVVLIISLMYPVPMISKYPIMLSVGCLIYSIVEWMEWGVETVTDGRIIAKYPKKYSNWKTKIIKLVAIIVFIILPIIELITNIELIPFPIQ
jgi:hypothetical protein